MSVTPIVARLLRARRDLVRRLFALPLYDSEIAQVLVLDPATVKNDRRVLHHQHEMPERMYERNAIPFQERLQCFLAARAGTLDGIDPELQERISALLTTFLGLKEAETCAQALLLSADPTQSIGIDLSLVSTRRLVDAIFDPMRPQPQPFDFTAQLVRWSTWTGKDVEIVNDAHDLARNVVAFFIFQTMIHSTASEQPPCATQRNVVVTNATKIVLDQAYATLTEAQRTSMERRFPRDGSPGKTLQELGHEAGTSYQAFQQIIDRSKDVLRTFLLAHHNVSPVSLLDVDVVALRQELTEAHKQREELDARLKVVERERDALLPMLDERRSEDGVGSQALQLLRRVNTLRRSTRLRRCLEREGFEYLWQVCEKSEYYMLGVKNFGDTTLDELKSLLEPLGLSLRMTIPESVKGR